jgi:hypothetical protein
VQCTSNAPPEKCRAASHQRPRLSRSCEGPVARPRARVGRRRPSKGRARVIASPSVTRLGSRTRRITRCVHRTRVSRLEGVRRDHAAASRIEHLCHARVVPRSPMVRSSAAVHRRCRGLGHRVLRIHAGGPGGSHRLHEALPPAGQGAAGGHHAGRLRTRRDATFQQRRFRTDFVWAGLCIVGACSSPSEAASEPERPSAWDRLRVAARPDPGGKGIESRPPTKRLPLAAHRRYANPV